jgi:methyltransferase-like protein/SAM-dependent methyltransferase
MPHTSQSTSYDQLPYPDMCYTQTHPGRLAACARLLGLTPAPVERCRVLELGCASGANLLPMADALPDSTFVGIDLSPRQIAEANRVVQALGLRNVSFAAMDIRELPEDLGEFDYIIAHGVYSWVPPDVRDSLLAACRTHLASHGIAYVSYNAFPGWHAVQALREMMLYHIRDVQEPLERATKARELLEFLARSVSDEQNQVHGSAMAGYRELLEQQLQDPRSQVDAVLLHDELEEHNDPVYFWQFAEHAAQHGLQFLVEAEFPLSVPSNLSDEVVKTLNDVCQDIIETEQYMDFVRNRAFRRTLLCHESEPVDRTLRTARVRELAVSTKAERVDDDAEEETTVAQYRASDGASFQTEHPFTIAAMDHLVQCGPQALPFGELVRAATQRLDEGEPSGEDITRLAAGLLRAFTYSLSLVELHGYAPAFVTMVGECPLAFKMARYQAREGDRVPNVRHERVHLDPLGRYILPHLDGQHTLDDLMALLDDLLARDAERKQPKDQATAAAQAARERVREELESTLEWLARAALLVS